MEYFKLNLKFDDENHSLTRERGLTIKEVSDLLKALADLGPDPNSLVLSEIKGNCYALEVASKNEAQYSHLKVIHESIANQKMPNAGGAEKKYVKALRSILKKGNGRDELRLTVYNNAKDFEFKIPLESLNFLNNRDLYTIDFVTGQLVSIGLNKSDKNTYIKLDTYKGVIRIKDTDESELYKSYKKGKIRLCIRRNLGGDKKRAETELLSFKQLSSMKMSEVAEGLRGETYTDIEDSVKSVRELRDNNSRD